MVEMSIAYRSYNIDDRRFVCLIFVVCPCLFGHQCPQFVQVNRWTPVLLPGQMEVAHSNFAKVTRMTVVSKSQH